MWLQIYFLPCPKLARIPFCALKVDNQFLIQRAVVAQAPSLHALMCAKERNDIICKETQLLSKDELATSEQVIDRNSSRVYVNSSDQTSPM